MKQNFKLLDTTLRDGSYAVNFSFDVQDVKVLCRELEEMGFEYIEIGHGVGFRGSEKGYGNATQTDDEYMRAAAETLSKSKFGMFCIPGIGELDDLRRAADFGMGFVRIGTNATNIDDSHQFVELANKLGMMTCVNYMKSYMLSPKEFAENVKKSESYGADIVYVVDSSGGMNQTQISEYYEKIRAVSNIKIGFHAHDNLSLASENSIHAIRLGYDIVDCSLQGLGRGAGNASTEVLIARLLKEGIETHFDLFKIIDLGYSYISPLRPEKIINPLDLICGYADFHSSYMRDIRIVSSKYQVDPLKLIVAYTQFNKLDIDIAQLEEVASGLEVNPLGYSAKYKFHKYFGNEQY